MSVATLADVLQPALKNGYAVAGLVTLGWEDMRAFTRAAETVGCPVILQAGPSCRAHTPLSILGAMFRHLAENASVPVVAHLDHSTSVQECRAALEAGFTSVMFDGSRLPLAQNIDETARVAELAHSGGITCEGEIGFVGYAEGEGSDMTDPEEAARFARETGVDAIAVSVGNVHLQRRTSAGVDLDAVRAIEAATNTPLVLHGASGIPHDMRRTLATTTSVCKFNIGTELRQVFGASLRAGLAAHPDRFDRVEILSEVEAPLSAAAADLLRGLS